MNDMGSMIVRRHKNLTTSIRRLPYRELGVNFGQDKDRMSNYRMSNFIYGCPCYQSISMFLLSNHNGRSFPYLLLYGADSHWCQYGLYTIFIRLRALPSE